MSEQLNIQVNTSSVTQAIHTLDQLAIAANNAATAAGHISTSVSSSSSATASNTTSINNLTAALNAANHQYAQMATQLGVLNGSIGSLNTSFGSLGTSVNNTSFAFKGLGTLLAGISIGSFVTGLIETNRQMEDLRVRLTSAYGDGAIALQKFNEAQTLAAKTPFEVKDITQGMITLKNFGIEPTTQVLQSFTDTAAKAGGGAQTLSALTLQLGQAWAKGKLGAEDMNVLVERGIPVYGILEKALGKTTEQIVAMREAGELGRGAIQKFIDTAGTMNFGASERAMDTLTGAFSNVSDSWTRFQDALLNDQGSNALKSSATSLADSLNFLAGHIDAVFETIQGAALIAVGAISSVTAAMILNRDVAVQQTAATLAQATASRVNVAESIASNTAIQAEAVANATLARSQILAATSTTELAAAQARLTAAEFAQQHTTASLITLNTELAAAQQLVTNATVANATAVATANAQWGLLVLTWGSAIAAGAGIGIMVGGWANEFESVRQVAVDFARQLLTLEAVITNFFDKQSARATTNPLKWGALDQEYTQKLGQELSKIDSVYDSMVKDYVKREKATTDAAKTGSDAKVKVYDDGVKTQKEIDKEYLDSYKKHLKDIEDAQKAHMSVLESEAKIASLRIQTAEKIGAITPTEARRQQRVLATGLFDASQQSLNDQLSQTGQVTLPVEIKVTEGSKSNTSEYLKFIASESKQKIINELKPIYEEIGKKYGVSSSVLMAQGYAESRFDSGAVGSSGEKGVAQFMLDTAKQYGLVLTQNGKIIKDMRTDNEAAIDAQARYMRDNLRSTNNDYRSALAKYNAGHVPQTSGHPSWGYADSILSNASATGTQTAEIGKQIAATTTLTNVQQEQASAEKKIRSESLKDQQTYQLTIAKFTEEDILRAYELTQTFKNEGEKRLDQERKLLSQIDELKSLGGSVSEERKAELLNNIRNKGYEDLMTNLDKYTSAESKETQLQREYLAIQRQITDEFKIRLQLAKGDSTGAHGTVAGVSKEQSDAISKAKDAFDSKVVKDLDSSLSSAANSMDNLVKSMGNLGSTAADTAALLNGGFGSIITTLNNVSDAFTTLGTKHDDLTKIYVDGADKISNSTASDEEKTKQFGALKAEYIKNETKLNKESFAVALSGTRQVIGATANMFDQKSNAAKTLHNIEKGIAVAELAFKAQAMAADILSIGPKVAAGVATMFAESGWFGFAGAAAFLALMAGLGFSGGGSGNVSVPSATTGTVLGDSSKSSESVKNITDTLDNIHASEYRELRQLNQNFQKLGNSIQDAIASVFQVGGLKSNFSGTGTDLNFGLTSTLLGGIIDIPVIGDILDWIDSSLFGSTETSVKEVGIKTDPTKLSQVGQKGVNPVQYQVNHVEESGAFFGLFGGDSYDTDPIITKLNDEITFNINAVFKSAAESFKDASKIFGGVFDKQIAEYVLPALKIDLKDLKGEDATKKLTAVINTALDTAAKDIFQVFKSYQKIGEGFFETVSRLVIDFGVVHNSFGLLGLDLQYNNGEAVKTSEALIKYSGDLQTFRTNIEDFSKSFLSEGEQFGASGSNLIGTLMDLGQVMPTTRQKWADLQRQLLAGGESTAEAAAGMLQLTNAADSFFKYLDEAVTIFVNLGKQLKGAEWAASFNTAIKTAMTDAAITAFNTAAKTNFTRDTIKEQYDTNGTGLIELARTNPLLFGLAKDAFAAYSNELTQSSELKGIQDDAASKAQAELTKQTQAAADALKNMRASITDYLNSLKTTTIGTPIDQVNAALQIARTDYNKILAGDTQAMGQIVNDVKSVISAAQAAYGSGPTAISIQKEMIKLLTNLNGGELSYLPSSINGILTSGTAPSVNNLNTATVSSSTGAVSVSVNNADLISKIETLTSEVKQLRAEQQSGNAAIVNAESTGVDKIVQAVNTVGKQATQTQSARMELV